MHPPGKAISALPVRESSGPRRRIDARILQTWSSDGRPLLSFDAFISRVFFVNFICAPSERRMLIIERMSAMSGTFVRVVFSFVRSEAHMIGSTAFFEPLTWIVPFSFCPPFTMSLAINFSG